MKLSGKTLIYEKANGPEVRSVFSAVSGRGRLSDPACPDASFFSRFWNPSRLIFLRAAASDDENVRAAARAQELLFGEDQRLQEASNCFASFKRLFWKALSYSRMSRAVIPTAGVAAISFH